MNGYLKWIGGLLRPDKLINKMVRKMPEELLGFLTFSLLVVFCDNNKVESNMNQVYLLTF